MTVDMRTTFGEQVRYYRRQCTDPLRGGLLTQDRLGELIGDQMGDAGYSGAAVSEWERNKSKIHADDRLVLLSLLAVFVQCGGLGEEGQADQLLAAGNYRRLDREEFARLFEMEAAPVVDTEARQKSPQHNKAAPARREKQLILLEKVDKFWVEGVLEKSLQGAPVFAIPRRYLLEAIDHPWDDQVGAALIAQQEAQAESPLDEIFFGADRALLILGAPGSGKTTTLITLAGQLVERARADWKQPVPVVLDLASWARMPLKLEDWAVEEMAAKYQIPRRYGRQWLTASELTLLLDGLDALPLEARRSCMEAINAFRENHGLVGIAVCCRMTEYQETEKQLRLCGAVALQPLQDDQVADYLAERDEALLDALSASRELQAMARNPLMLNLVASVFTGGGGRGPGADLRDGTADVPLLLDAYVARMFGQKAAHEQFTQAGTTAWLVWLAKQMNAHGQTIFLIEKLQPSWLPGRWWRRLYMLLSGLITGLAGGVIMWLLWGLLRHTLPQLPSPVSSAMAYFLDIPINMTEPLTIVLGNLLLGLLLGVTLLVLFERRMAQPVDVQTVRSQRRAQVLLIGVGSGVTAALFVLLFSNPLLGLAWGVAEGFMYGAAAQFVFGWSYQTEVRTVEALGWSWGHAATGVATGLALGMVAEVIESALYGYNGAARTLMTLMVAGFVLGGLRGRSAATKSRPNQGVWLSLRNAIAAALVLSMTLAALALLIRDATYAWQIGLLSAVIAAALMGASVFVKHFLLRIMLRVHGDVPFAYARFLDYAAQLVLLRKVGNGYIFMHGLLQSYFAGAGD